MLRATVLLGLVTINLAFFMNDKCTVLPKGFIPVGETEDYTADPSCTNGTVDWNYPRSAIRVHFKRPSSTFRVCFTENIGGDMFGLTDVTDGAHRALPPLSRDSHKAVCISSVNGEAVLRIQAPEFQTYMGAVDFKIMTTR